MDKIFVTQSSMPSFEEYCDEIKDIWETKWLTNFGEKHDELKRQLKQYLAVKNLSLFTNGHLALEGILECMELSGEVITTPYTFVSTTNAIIRNGLTPIFCDISMDDFNIDVTKIENLITENTSAILPVHVYGNPVKYKKIQEIADKYNLKVIYDAAHAFGVVVDNIKIANLGDASMFSFHATKVFNTIEGGAVTFKDSVLVQKFHKYKNFGVVGPETITYTGTNAKMNEFQSAMGICNLRHIDMEISKRKQIYNRYIENLLPINKIKLNFIPENVIYNYAYFPVLFKSGNRDKICEILMQHNVVARKYFYPLTNTNVAETPIANYISQNILTLPLYSDLSLTDVDKICSIIVKNL